MGLTLFLGPSVGFCVLIWKGIPFRRLLLIWVAGIIGVFLLGILLGIILAPLNKTAPEYAKGMSFLFAGGFGSSLLILVGPMGIVTRRIARGAW